MKKNGIIFKKDYWFCGQCIIPPNTFPIECLNPEIASLRKELNIQSDEVWITPFILKNHITILPKKLKYAFTSYLDSYFNESQESGLWLKFKKEGYNKFDYFKKVVEVLNTKYNYNIVIE